MMHETLAAAGGAGAARRVQVLSAGGGFKPSRVKEGPSSTEMHAGGMASVHYFDGNTSVGALLSFDHV